MLKDKCRQFEESLSRGEKVSEELRAHAARCPECAALAATEFKISAVPTASEDPVLRATLARASEIGARRATRDERRRRLVPVLIGLVGYALGAEGIAATLLLRDGGIAPMRPTPEFSAPFAAPSLPAPSPATVGVVALIAVVWMAGMLAWVRRRERLRVES